MNASFFSDDSVPGRLDINDLLSCQEMSRVEIVALVQTQPPAEITMQR